MKTKVQAENHWREEAMKIAKKYDMHNKACICYFKLIQMAGAEVNWFIQESVTKEILQNRIDKIVRMASNSDIKPFDELWQQRVDFLSWLAVSQH